MAPPSLRVESGSRAQGRKRATLPSKASSTGFIGQRAPFTGRCMLLLFVHVPCPKLKIGVVDVTCTAFDFILPAVLTHGAIHSFTSLDIISESPRA